MWFRHVSRILITTASRRPPVRWRRQPRRAHIEALEGRSLLSYVATDLGPYGVADMNDSAQVVGSHVLASGEEHAYLLHQGQMIDLGTLGGSVSQASGINDLGQIVGRSNLKGQNDAYRAFLLTPEDTNGDGSPDRWFRDSNADGANDLMRDLGTLGGVGATSSAADVNNLGQVVGSSSWLTSPYTTTSRAVLWQDGSITELSSGGATTSHAAAINDAGVIAGWGYFAPGYGHTLVWKNGGMADLGISGGAQDVNASGQLLDSTFGNFSYARTWTPAIPNGTSGSYTTLAPLPPIDDPNLPYYVDSTATPVAMNDAGAAVGSQSDYYFFGEDGGWLNRGALLWADGQAQALPLDTAVAINDAGQILGTRDGRAVLLTPGASAPPRITIGDASVREGNSGTAVATFTVTLSAASTEAVTVAYATADGTATAAGDYQAMSGTLSFAPGETSKTITVPVRGDRAAEPDESFLVNLSGPSNASIAKAQGVGTILDDEPRISIGDVIRSEGMKGKTTLFTFTVTLSAAYDQAVSTSFRTLDGTAKTSDRDYVAKSGTLTFQPGQTTKTITIEVKGDSKYEVDEGFYVDLFSNSGNSLFAKKRGIGTILNDDRRSAR